MNTSIRNRVLSALGAGALLIASAGSAMAISPIGASIYRAERFNTAGTTIRTMTAASSTHCFLTRVAIQEPDSNGETAECRIVSSGGNWVLEAFLAQSNDADVWCSARCYTNN